MDHSIKINLGEELIGKDDENKGDSDDDTLSKSKDKKTKQKAHKRAKKKKHADSKISSSKKAIIFIVFVFFLFAITFSLRAYLASFPSVSKTIRQNIYDSIKSSLVNEYSSKQYALLSPQQRSEIVYKKYLYLINDPKTEKSIKRAIENARSAYKNIDDIAYFYNEETFKHYYHAKNMKLNDPVAFADYLVYKIFNLFSHKTLFQATSYVSLIFFLFASIVVYLIASRIAGSYAGLISGILFSVHPFMVKSSLIGISDKTMLSLFFVSVVFYSLVSALDIFRVYAQSKKFNKKIISLLVYVFLICFSLYVLKKTSFDFYFLALFSVLLSVILSASAFFAYKRHYKSKLIVLGYAFVLMISAYLSRKLALYFGSIDKNTGFGIGYMISINGAYLIAFAIVGLTALVYLNLIDASCFGIFSSFFVVSFSLLPKSLAMMSFVLTVGFGISFYYLLKFAYEKLEFLEIKSKEIQLMGFVAIIMLILVPYASSVGLNFNRISASVPVMDDAMYNTALDIGLKTPKDSVMVLWDNKYPYSAIANREAYSTNDKHAKEMISKFFLAHNLFYGLKFLDNISADIKDRQKIIVLDSSILGNFKDLLFYANNEDVFSNYDNIILSDCFRKDDSIKCRYSKGLFFLNLSSNFTNADIAKIVLVNISTDDRKTNYSIGNSSKTTNSKTINIINYAQSKSKNAVIIYKDNNRYHAAFLDKQYLDTVLIRMIFFDYLVFDDGLVLLSMNKEFGTTYFAYSIKAKGENLKTKQMIADKHGS